MLGALSILIRRKAGSAFGFLLGISMILTSGIPPQPQLQGFNKHFHSPLPFLQVVRNVEVLVSVLSAAKPPTSTASKANHGPPWPAWATSGIPTLGPAALGSSWGPSGPAEAHMKSAVTPPGPRWRTSWAPVPPPGPEWAPQKLFNKSVHRAGN